MNMNTCIKTGIQFVDDQQFLDFEQWIEQLCVDAEKAFAGIDELVNEGEMDPILAYVKMKKTIEKISQSINNVKNKAIEEAQRYDEKENIVVDGKKVSISKTNHCKIHTNY